ncbi:MAG: methyltransferase domain-containing protein [Gemmatimonadetes bacterium]|nr:methyltransferase domain-containing protein [Gemmatimonadota bacterium]
MTPSRAEKHANSPDSREPGGTDRASPRRWWMLPLKLVLAAAITWLILRGAGLTLAEAWAGVDWSVVQLNVPFLVLSAALLLVGFVIPAALWSRVLAAFGETPVPVLQAAAMLLVANLGRYVPGKVVQVAGLAVLARRAGMSAVRATGAAIVAQILNLIGAAILGGWVAYQMNDSTGAAGLAVGFGAVLALVAFLYFGGAEVLLRWTLKRVGHSGELPRATGRRLLLLVPGYILNWLVFGAAFASLAAGLGLPIPLVFATTAFAAAYFAGYISLLPAGIGVREGSLIFLLTPLVGAGPSVVLAALQRVWVTALELTAAAAGAWLLRGSGSAGAEPVAERIGKSYYDETAYFADGTHMQDFGSRFQRYRVAKVLELHTPDPGNRVLDLGCGWGTISFALGPGVREVVGLDFSERAVAGCSARLGPLGLDNVSFVCADARATRLPPASFDSIVAADLFEHLYPEDSEAVAREALRVLKPGGRLAVWTPCRTHILEVLKNNNVVLKRDVSHVDYKSMPRMKQILTDAGFEIERAYFAESHLPGLVVAERLLQKWVPLLRRRVAVLAVKPEAA